MLEGVEKETLEKWDKECNEKYHKLFIQTLQKPLLGEIGTNEQMIKELKDLNMSYFDEMSDYTDSTKPYMKISTRSDGNGTYTTGIDYGPFEFIEENF